MGVRISQHVVRGSRFTYSPSQSGAFIQKFLVTGLDPTNGSTPALAAYATDSVNGFYIPQYGDAHPQISNFFAHTIESEPFPDVSLTQCMVTVTYRPPENIPANTQIEISSSSGTIALNYWPSGPLAGQAIIVGYNPNPTSFPNQIAPSSVDLTSGNFYSNNGLDWYNPGMILRYTRRESSSPMLKGQQYRNHVNSATFQGGAKGTWFCHGIDGVNIVGGGSPIIAPGWYNVTYTFEWNPLPNAWSRYAVFKNNLDGSTPPGIDIKDGTNNGYTIVNPPQIDFNSLSLPTAL